MDITQHNVIRINFLEKNKEHIVKKTGEKYTYTEIAITNNKQEKIILRLFSNEDIEIVN